MIRDDRSRRAQSAAAEAPVIGALAGVGDQVTDAQGFRAIVTDIRGGTVWVLRPVAGGTSRWETDQPDGLTVVRRRADRITDP
ncbi:hypothetical protein [Streptomyces sp. NBC_00239]|uniref:hypothetical protein n=1 Tax=Streptomyces sp. NBC_00239 TaxID=2903640 RepID=UPI002E2A7180|nr:hypothetical protein [Streptomyces sp. NBC_00239]